MDVSNLVFHLLGVSSFLWWSIESSRKQGDHSILVIDFGCEGFERYFDGFEAASIPAFRLARTYYDICRYGSNSVDAETARSIASDAEEKAKAIFPTVEERKAFTAALPEILCKRLEALTHMVDITQRMRGYKHICSSMPGSSFRFFVARTEHGTDLGGVGALFFEAANSTAGDECGEIQLKPFVYMVGMHKTPAEVLIPHLSNSSIVPALEGAVAKWAWSQGAAYLTAPRPLGPMPRKLAILGWVNRINSGLSADAKEAFSQNDCALKFWLAHRREQLDRANLPSLGPDSPLKTRPDVEAAQSLASGTSPFPLCIVLYTFAVMKSSCCQFFAL
eukprot:TRINITY_DN9185_c0_g1_i1.p1 TRINITY_DN9185_c0_g1~~TRINITY_DN9185_c0_g1_i1.p1  ORF type:complete len:334 (+),score=18.84 TRINITY_DN9185_c0_g1_i1:181-1182(+)